MYNGLGCRMRLLCGLFTCLFDLILLAELCALPEMESDSSSSTSSNLFVSRSNYVLFSADIVVNYTIGKAQSTDSFKLQLVNNVNGNLISTFPLSPNSSSGEVIVTCGEITFAGEIIFFLVRNLEVIVATSEKINVSWPSVTIRTITRRYQFMALTEDIAIDIIVDYWKRLSCPWNDSMVNYTLSLEFFGSVDGRVSTEVTSRSDHVQYISRLFNRREHSLNFSCSLFDQTGHYRVFLRAPIFPGASTIAVSDYLKVDWNSDSYKLRTTIVAIFPCLESVIVYFSQPKCAATEDKVRLYKREDKITVGSSVKLVYLAERRARKLFNQVDFPCSLFEDMAPVYCWKYISTARSGAIYEHTTLCLPATATERPTDGRWSSWSEWSTCSATCLTGTQIRFRSCDNPSPANGGAFCVGPMTESRLCDVICPDLFSETTISYNRLPTNASCECGCRLTEPHGTVVAMTGCSDVAQWVIEVKAGQTIRLSFLVFDIQNDGQTNVKVRDGETPMCNLLLNSYETRPPSEIMSSGNLLMIEFRAPVNYSGGFVAKYSTQVRNASGNTEQVSSEGAPAWKSVVIVVGVALCSSVIIVAIVVVCCDVIANRRARRTKKRHHPKGRRAQAKKGMKSRGKDESRGKGDAPGAIEASRVYPRTAPNDIIPSEFLATSSPYLEPSDRDRNPHFGKQRPVREMSGRNKDSSLPSKPRQEEQYVDAICPLGVPIDFPPQSKPPTRTRSNKENSGTRHSHRSRTHDWKPSHPPPPSSTFEEDFLMLARQNDVAESGVASTRTSGVTEVEVGPEVVIASPDVRRSRGKNRSGAYFDRNVPENIPLQPSGARKHTVQYSKSSRSRSNTDHRPIAGQERPPVEGSYDSKDEQGHKMFSSVLFISGQGSRTEGSTPVKDASVVMTTRLGKNPQVTDFESAARETNKSSPGFLDPKDSSTSETARRMTNEERPSGSQVIQSSLRSDAGPDGQSQRTLRSRNNSFNGSNPASFNLSTERMPTRNSFRPDPSVQGSNHNLYQTLDTTSILTNSASKSPRWVRNSPQMTSRLEPIQVSIPVVPSIYEERPVLDDESQEPKRNS